MFTFSQFIVEQKNMAQWKKLAHNDIVKNSTRLDRFLSMVKSGSEFLTVKGVVVIDKKEYDRLAVEMREKRYSTTIKSGSTTIKYPNDFYKTSEFGGRGVGSGVSKENIELISLRKQIDAAKIADGVQSINIKVGDSVFEVAGAESTPGTPKSDFHLIDISGKSVCWISHKDGSTPKDIQQWGGISKAKEPLIFNDDETQQFIADLKTKWPDGINSGYSAYRKIKDSALKFMSVYGNKYGGRFSEQNVNILLQGSVDLVKTGSQYKLSANHVHYNGTSFDNTPYEAVLAVRYGDRSDAGIFKARIVIMAIGARNWKETI